MLILLSLNLLIFCFTGLKDAQLELIGTYTAITQSVDVLPFEDSASLPIADIFTPLLMEEDLRAKERMPNLNSPSGKELKSLREVFSAGDKPAKRIFMKGEAGYGKTLFCLKMLDSWCQVKQSGTVSDDVLQQCLAVFDLVFYIPLRYFKGEVSLVKEMIRQTVSERCHMVLVNSQIHSLVILDGLDESPFVSKELPSMLGLVNYVLFCTTRPWKLNQMLLKFRPDDKVVQILGLLPSSEAQVIEYVLINFYKLKHETQEFKTKCKRYSSMVKSLSSASLVKIPMVLTACLCMWYEEGAHSDQSNASSLHATIDSPTALTSMTYTYLSLIDSMIRRADEKHDLKYFHTKVHPSPERNFPKALSKFPYVHSFLDTLLPLCRLAYTDLISDETKLVFQKEELGDKIGRPLVQLALRVGLISQSKAPGRFYQQNVSINFHHKTIQEIMAAIHLTCTDTDDIRAYCTSLDKVMEVNNIITFMTGIDSSFCCGVSKHVMGIVNSDKNVQQYRHSLHCGNIERVKQLYQAQCGWYREATYCQALTGDTSPPPTLHVSEIYLNNASDIDTVRITEEIMNGNLDNIVSLILAGVQHPLQRVLKQLPRYPHLSTLFISYMRNKEDNDQLLSVIPHLTQLDNIVYGGAAVITAAGTDDDLEDILPVYDEADVKVVKTILQLTQLKRMWLFLVVLSDEDMEVTGNKSQLQEVRFSRVIMSARSCDRFLSSVLNLHQAVVVGLLKTKIDDSMVKRILTSPHFTVTEDDVGRDEIGRYKWLRFSTVPHHKKCKQTMMKKLTTTKKNNKNKTQ